MVVIRGVVLDVAFDMAWGRCGMSGVVVLVDLVPNPAWLCVSIREGGGMGWHSPGSALPTGGRWWCSTMVVAEDAWWWWWWERNNR